MTNTISPKPKFPTLPLYDHAPEPYVGPSKAEVVAVRQQYLSPGLIRYYKEPLMIVEGHMQYVWDETGKRFFPTKVRVPNSARFRTPVAPFHSPPRFPQSRRFDWLIPSRASVSVSSSLPARFKA